MRSFIKIIIFNIFIWIFLVFAYATWINSYIKRNPIPPSPDGGIPDSISIPIAGFAFELFIFLAVINTLYLSWKTYKGRKNAGNISY